MAEKFKPYLIAPSRSVSLGSTGNVKGSTLLAGSVERNTLSDVERCGAWIPKRQRHCQRPAGAGTQHSGYGTCKLHGGMTRAATVSAVKEEAHAAAIVMGMPIDIDPLEGLLQCIRITAGEVVYCSTRILALSEDEAMVQSKEVIRRRGAMGGTETRTSSDRTLNAWVMARQNAVDHLARYCKMAIDCGIAERQVRVAESMGEAIGGFINAVLSDLNLNAAQRANAPAIVAQRLAILDVNPS
jgi:hypothetical protein